MVRRSALAQCSVRAHSLLAHGRFKEGLLRTGTRLVGFSSPLSCHAPFKIMSQLLERVAKNEIAQRENQVDGEWFGQKPVVDLVGRKGNLLDIDDVSERRLLDGRHKLREH